MRRRARSSRPASRARPCRPFSSHPSGKGAGGRTRAQTSRLADRIMTARRSGQDPNATQGGASPRPCRPFSSRHSAFGRERTAERGHRHPASLKAWRRALQLIHRKVAACYNAERADGPEFVGPLLATNRARRLDRWLHPLYPTKRPRFAQGGSGAARSKAVTRRVTSPSSTAGSASPASGASQTADTARRTALRSGRWTRRAGSTISTTRTTTTSTCEASRWRFVALHRHPTGGVSLSQTLMFCEREASLPTLRPTSQPAATIFPELLGNIRSMLAA
jgi:hypothetical protein